MHSRVFTVPACCWSAEHKHWVPSMSGQCDMRALDCPSTHRLELAVSLLSQSVLSSPTAVPVLAEALGPPEAAHTGVGVAFAGGCDIIKQLHQPPTHYDLCQTT